MAFENASHIDELVASSPTTADDPWGVNAIYLELQQIKTVLTTDFPNVDAAVNFTPTEANVLAGVTAGTAAASKAVTADASAEIAAAAITWTNLGTVTTVDINGGSIDGVTIDAATVGATTPAAGSFTTLDATTSVGYATGAGGTVTQATSRTTGVTVNAACGAITLVSAAGSATFATFTVTNSSVAAEDVVVVSQKSGTDLYHALVTAVAAGSFNLSLATTGGTTTEQPVFNFAVIKAVTS